MLIRKYTGYVSVGLLVSVLASGCTKFGTAHAEAKAEPPAGAAPVSILPNPALSKAGGVSIADIAEKVLPSVVNISLTKSRSNQRSSPIPFFFGPPDEQGRGEQGMGSGVVVSADGTILTNNHVVADATEIKVTTHDKREFEATVVGTDPKSDLAVIKLKGNVSDLRPVEFGDSSRLRLGDVVLAVGNPFGVGQTVTMGIVSAKGRADLGIVDYEDFIQTDAAINPGNSGGALINMEGQLVGVNTAILSRSGGYQGIGFAIPTSMAVPIMESLKKNGHVVRGWLGVGIQEVDAELASAMKLPAARGIVLSDVRPGTPAARAGLRRGDVVTKLEGKPITSVGQFRNVIAATGARTTINLEVSRDGKTQNVPVTLGTMPTGEGTVVPATGGDATPSAPSSLSGVTLGELSPQTRRAFEVPADVTRGVVVTRVDPQSTAAQAGLRPGDVVMEVNRLPVDSLKVFQDAFAKTSGKVLLLVHRRGNTVFLVVRR